MSKAQEVMDRCADSIIKSIEQGLVAGQWQKPWHSSQGLPVNALTKKHYLGGNTIALWITQMVNGYTSTKWATYKQWAQLDAQVRKGETATMGIKWTLKVCRDHSKTETCTQCGRMIPSVFFVFNADQVDGYTPPAVAQLNQDERNDQAERVLTSTGATVRHHDGGAYYRPDSDDVWLPHFEQFFDAASYYSVFAHETIHWTGHKSRTNRDLTGRFGDNSYAMEELVAELGSAMLCALLGIEDKPRVDHAQYLSHWLSVLKEDSKALWTAASQASKAVAYVQQLTGLGVEPVVADAEAVA